MIHTYTAKADQTVSVAGPLERKAVFPSPRIPDLVALQYGSFQQFLLYGFIETFEQSTPLRCQYGNNVLDIQFFPECIQFKKPDGSAHDALYFGKTYGCSVYIPALISSTQWPEPKIEWLLVGFLPLMTSAGHFIINGIPRVVLYQMVRNPGVYVFLNDSRTQAPTIRIVPEQGSWINITVDKKNRLWIGTRLLRRKLSVLIFLQALGVELSDIAVQLKYSELLASSLVSPVKNTDKSRHGRILERAELEDHPKSQEEAYRYIYAHYLEYSGKTEPAVVSSESSETFFSTTLWDPKKRQLGLLGREQFRQKIGSITSSSDTLLQPDDMVRATQALLELISGERQGDDIDSLSNKKIQGCGEFLKDQLAQGLRDFEQTLTRKLVLNAQSELDVLWKLQKSSLSKSVSKAWKSFFTSGTLSQFLDETNPLAETTHKRRITVLGPGGVSSKQTTIQIRGIHPTYYGRLCPIETPEGQNAGLVNSLTVFARPNSLGHIETPLYRVYKGQVQKYNNPHYTIPHQESQFSLAPADIPVSQTLTFPKAQLPIRKDWKFEYGLWNQITRQSVGILQMISVATSLIPFLEHDDANRALMGSNMQRQAVPLIQPEAAYVQTGLESRVISDICHSLHAPESGYIAGVSARGIRMYRPEHHPLSLVPQVSSLSNLTQGFFYSTLPVHSTLQLNLTPLRQDGLENQCDRPIPSTAESNRSLLSLLPTFSPLSIKPQDQQPTEACIGTKAYFVPPAHATEMSLLHNVPNRNNEKTEVEFGFHSYQRTNQSTCKYHRPLVREGEWIQKSDILADGAASVGGKVALGKNILVAYLPWEGYNFEDAILISDRLVREDVFTSLHIDYYELEVKNTQHGLETITSEVPIEVTDSDRELVRIQTLQENGLVPVGTWVEEGDYLVGKISPLNPKGPSIQQQYEKLYNVIMEREHTNVRNTSLRVPKGVEGFVYDVQILPPKEADVLALAPKNALLRVRVALLQRRTIQVGDKMAGRHGNKGIVSKILSEYDMPYLPDGTPVDIVLNPLGVPSRMNVGQILECLLGFAGKYLNESYTIDLFDEQAGSEASRTFVYSKLFEASIKTGNSWLFEPHHPGKIKLFDGRTGDPFDQAITVGCAYMLKLVHLVDDKIHARATGPYSAITQQPVRGRSRNGGQRVGEMEVWALQGYGAAYILQELLTVKSDDVDGRKEAVFQIYTNRPLRFGPPESFRVLVRELQALCFDLKLFTDYRQTGTLKALNLQFLEDLGSREI
jgi:DNA-directed RNA polymerase subunit beta